MLHWEQAFGRPMPCYPVEAYQTMVFPFRSKGVIRARWVRMKEVQRRKWLKGVRVELRVARTVLISQIAPWMFASRNVYYNRSPYIQLQDYLHVEGMLVPMVITSLLWKGVLKAIRWNPELVEAAMTASHCKLEWPCAILCRQVMLSPILPCAKENRRIRRRAILRGMCRSVPMNCLCKG